MKLVHKVLSTEITPVDGESRTFWAVASTESEDRGGDIIRSDGWLLDNFLKNPVIPWAHRYADPPVAKALEAKVENGQLMIKIQFATAEEYPFAETIFRLYNGGYLRAFSVGFDPIESKDLGGWAREYTKQELYEVSCVTVPANPEALRKAMDEGNLTEYEAQELEGKSAFGLAMWDRMYKQDDKIKGLAAQVEALEQKLSEQPKLDPEAAAHAAQAAERVDQLEARLKALEEAQAHQQPEQTINPATLAAAISKLAEQTIRSAVSREIKYHLGQDI